MVPCAGVSVSGISWAGENHAFYRNVSFDNRSHFYSSYIWDGIWDLGFWI